MADNKKYRSETVLITPEMAREFLAKNNNNRPVSKAKVESFAKQMREGLWLYNGQGISIGPTGRLLNGQHRMMAIIAANKSVWMPIAWGVPDESFPTLDCTGQRTGADTAAIMGWKHATVAAAVLSIVTSYDRRIFSWGAWHSLTAIEVRAELGKHPKIAESIVAVAQTGDRLKIFRQSWCPAAHFIFSRIDKAQADLFMSRLINGEELKSHEPVFKLRKALMALNGLPRPPLKGEALGMTIRAWNATREERTSWKCQRPRITKEVSDPFPYAV